MSVFYRDIDVKISDYKSELSKPLVIFERDRGVEIYFNLVEYAYRLDKNPLNLLENLVGAYATVTLVNPAGYEISIDEVEITEDAKVKFVITEDLTDELTEIGIYQVQIHVNNDVEGMDTSVFSVPPFNFEVRERLKGKKSELFDSEDNRLTDEEGYQLVSATSSKIIKFSAAKINEYLKSIPTMQGEIKNLDSQLEHKANLNEVFLKSNGININNFDEETRKTFLESQGIDVNYVLGKRSVALENLNFVDINRQNLFDKSKAKIGYMLNSTGVEITNGSAFVSDYINISGCDTLTTNASWNSAFYNSNKEFIQVISSPHSSPITVPTSAYYIKIAGGADKIDSIMLSPSETLPTTYIDYNSYSVNITDTHFINELIKKTYKKIDINDTTFFKKVIANKVLNETLQSGFIGTTGDVVPNSDCKVTDFIEVLPNTTYEGNDTWNGGAYNENKEFIKTFKCNKATATTPGNCKYVRLSYSNSSINAGIYLYKVKNGITLSDDAVEFVKEEDAKSLAVQLGKYISNTSTSTNTNTNVLSGKSALYFGDSICYGEGYRGGYAKIISENNNMSYTNKGVSGATITRRDGVSCILDSVLNSTETADYIILEGGTNDAGGFQEFGTVTSGYSDTLDETTFCGAVESLLKNSLIKWHDKKICFILTTNTYRRPNQKEYFDSIKQICEKWGVPYLDLFTKGRLNTNIEIMLNNYTSDWQGNPDGLHPNEQGYKLFYVNQITEFLKTL